MNYFDYADISSTYMLYYIFIMLISSSIFIFVFHSKLMKSKKIIREKIYKFYDVSDYDNLEPYHYLLRGKTLEVGAINKVKSKTTSRKSLLELLFKRIQGNNVPLPTLKEVLIIHPLKIIIFYDLIKAKLELEVDKRMSELGKMKLKKNLKRRFLYFNALNINPTAIENDFESEINSRIRISESNLSNEKSRIFKSIIAYMHIAALIGYIGGKIY